MFDPDDAVSKPTEQAKNLENLSLSELSDHIDFLKSEIARAEAEIEKKKASSTAADAIFKS